MKPEQSVNLQQDFWVMSNSVHLRPFQSNESLFWEKSLVRTEKKEKSASDNSNIQKSTLALKCDPAYMTKWKLAKLNAGDNDESKRAVQPA